MNLESPSPECESEGHPLDSLLRGHSFNSLHYTLQLTARDWCMWIVNASTMADSVFFEKPALCVVSLLYLFSLVLKCDYKGVYTRTLENLCWLLWLGIIYTLVQECKNSVHPISHVRYFLCCTDNTADFKGSGFVYISREFKTKPYKIPTSHALLVRIWSGLRV